MTKRERRAARHAIARVLRWVEREEQWYREGYDTGKLTEQAQRTARALQPVIGRLRRAIRRTRRKHRGP